MKDVCGVSLFNRFAYRYPVSEVSIDESNTTAFVDLRNQ
jgi:hypothetical protein